jgi:DNA primase
MSLCDPVEGREARNWLYDRGIDTDAVSSFRLGYVPQAKSHCFSGRLVIPIFDQHGELLALSVRPVTNDKAVLDEYGKYWNERYDKGWHLFGLNLARLPIIKRRFAIVVEGQLDVASMHAYGFPNTVGVLGGAFTPWQAHLLSLWTKQVVLMFDGDQAGKDHADRAMSVLSMYGTKSFKNIPIHGLKTAIAKLPDKLDPNKFLLEHGSQAMRKLLGDTMKAGGLTLPRKWW